MIDDFMTYAFRFHQAGGPEVLKWEEVKLGKPGPGEARIRHTAVGLNFVDIYNRSGLYPAQLPSGLGSEAAGIVEEVGAGVTDLKPGDRVAYGASPLGAYSEARLIPADRLLKLPDGVDDKTAAAMMLKGLTTQYLIRQTYRVKAGDTILLHGRTHIRADERRPRTDRDAGDQLARSILISSLLQPPGPDSTNACMLQKKSCAANVRSCRKQAETLCQLTAVGAVCVIAAAS